MSLPLPAGIERRVLHTSRGAVVASHARPRPERDLGIAVLMVSGYVGSKEDFWPLLPGIAAAGYHAWAFDQLGQYESTGPDDAEAYSIDLLAEDVREVAAQVGDGTAVHLLGHCLGGFISRAAALAEPGAVRSLTLLACGPSMAEPKHDAMLTDLDRKLDMGSLELLWPLVKRLVPERDAALRDFWHLKLRTANAGFMRGTARAMRVEPDRTDELVASDVPVLVMHGRRDRRLWSRAAFAAMAGRLGAEHVVIDGAAHSPNSEQPDSTLDALLGFWADCRALSGVAS